MVRFYLINILVLWTQICSVKSNKNHEIVEILESSVIGSVVHKLPKSVDKNFAYTLYPYGDPGGLKHFSVSEDGNVILKSQFEYIVGKYNSFFIIVILRNKNSRYGGTPYPVKFVVKDTNNNSPKFHKKIYHGFIEEGMPGGSMVSGLEDCYATDLDSSGVIDYTIVEGNKKGFFMVETENRQGVKLVIVKTKKPIDRDEMHHTPHLDLLVRANDGGILGKDKKFETTVIRIQIKDRNDNPPVFLHTKWQTTIQENADIGTSVLKISASDNDAGSNSEIYFYFDRVNNDFFINPSTGVIRVARQLDNNRRDVYDLTVVAQDKSQTRPLKAESYLKIQVLNVPKYPPARANGGRNTRPGFKKSSFSVIIKQDLPVKSTVFFESATDPDPYGPMSDLTYTLRSNDGLFQISRESGIITLASSLQSVQQSTFVLYLTVTDGVGESDTAELQINVQHLNKNKYNPVFVPSTVNLVIPQNIEKNTDIGYKAYATDKDYSVDGEISYSIIEGTGIGRFKVDPKTGRITTSVLFKESGVYDLYISAQDHGKYRRKGRMYIRITVQSDVTISPIFSVAMYPGYAVEGTSNSFVGAVFARSLVPTKTVYYSIEGSPSFSGLQLNPVTGIIMTTRKISHNDYSSIFIEISAMIQGGNKASKTAMSVDVINKNINRPVFSLPSQTIYVVENAGNIPSVACLLALDKDGDKLEYSLKGGNSANIFSIDENTGQLSAKNLDYETAQKYQLTILASDGVHDAEATINVVVVDAADPPQFDNSRFFAEVNEKSLAGTAVKTLGVTSEVSGSHVCSWGMEGVTTDILSMFTLNTELSSCVLTVKTSGSIKWTKEQHEYSFEINAVNKNNRNEKSTTVLNVKIRDLNDHKPVFTQSSYAVSLSSDASKQTGRSIVKVRAVDADDGSNGKVSYTLQASRDSNYFTLNPSGDIILKTVPSANKEYVLTVNAEDQGVLVSKATAEVHISVHGVGTEMLSFGDGTSSVTIPENLPLNNDVMRVSGNNNDIQYSIVGGDFNDMFTISNTGLITLKKDLDYERTKLYRVVVRATEITVPPKYVEKTFTINIDDVNDNAPVFAVENPDAKQKIFIDRFASEGTIIYRVKAFDADSGTNGLVSYAAQGTGPITVDKDGNVIVTREIREQIGETFELNIIAFDSDTSHPKKATLNIVAEIKDGQKTPVFDAKTYTATLGDDVAIGTTITSITTSDTNPQSTATFRVASGDTRNNFCIDSNKMLTVQRPVDHDTFGEARFTLSIEMMDGYRTSKADVIVTLVDENDNRPTFLNGPGPVPVTVSEFSKEGETIYKPSVTDKDSGPNGQISYSILQVITRGHDNSPFTINPSTGAITLAGPKPLNFETADEYVVVIKAEDKGFPKRYALQELRIQVSDENDERPTFSETKYSEVISRTSEPGHTILQVIATDMDSGANGKVMYEITGGNVQKMFGIDSQNGYIGLLKPIALSSKKTFKLEIRAEDQKKLQSQAIVELNVVTEEGPPKFALSKFYFKVKENNNPDISIGRAEAISLDSLTYSIVKGNRYGFFGVDNDGEISSTVSLDAENATNYILYVRATDLSERFAEASVEINVINENDNNPEFRNANKDLIEAVVSRDSNVGTEIVTVEGYDKDVGDSVIYRIASAPDRAYFHIDQSGVINSLKSFKDFVVGSNEYTFIVSATDRNGVTNNVNIRIVLVNKQPGEIIRSMSEGTLLSDTSIIKIGYKYPRASFKIVYPDDNPFLIDTTTGNLRLRTLLDYERQHEYTIYIQEINLDQIREYVTYQVRIQVTDENDNKPQFFMNNYIGKVNKNALPGTVVMNILYGDADSGDAGSVYLEILPDTAPFSIDPFTAEITTTSWNLKEDWYNITVVATDRGKPLLSSSQRFYIKTGDNPPEFDRAMYLFVVSEDATPGKILGQLTARSLSGIPVRYDIESGNQNNVFNIDSQGQLTLQVPLDFESGSSTYTLSVVAKENNQNPLESRVNVVVEVTNENDNAPEFTQIEYSPTQPKSENLPIGETLLIVTATDKDCGEYGKCTGGILTYSLEKFKEIFSIDAVTGAITTIAPLDYELYQEYRFPVKVTDNGDNPLSGLADVVIPVKNANDNPPVFNPKSSSRSMAEVVKAGSVVKAIQAMDVDGDELTYSIETGGDGNFEIIEKTGVIQITTKKQPVFRSDEYLLNISAFDGLHKDFFELKISIEDVNDNSPVFTGCSAYRASVEEGRPVGTHVIKVVAIDNDRGRNGEIEYQLQEPQEFGGFLNSHFRINNATGLITTNAILDRERRNSFIVLVVALDGGHGRSSAERNSASCQLDIKVKDINDNEPKFLNSYNDGISIAENVPINKEVLRVRAQDLDEGSNSNIVYSIIDSGADSNFKIDFSGAISVARSLIGKLGSYTLEVRAKDNGNPAKQSTVKITIYVQSSNPPLFDKSTYKEWLHEDRKVGAEVLTVKAVSQGEGANTEIFYSLLPGTSPNSNYPPTFTINSNTGTIKVGKILDYERLSGYDLTVIARDERGLKTSAKVFINILDVNDNSPIFVLSNYEFGTVVENKPRGQIVGQVNATDPDSGISGQIRYSFVPSEESDMFQIDADTGQIRTNVSFDREETPKVTINVKAEDRGKPPLDSFVYVIVRVTDVNDNKPEFVHKQYNKTVDEDIEVGANVIQVRAIDLDIGENARLNYHIVSGNDKGYFGTRSMYRVDGRSVGYITVEKTLNREDRERFELKIAASDPGFDDTFTSVIINVRDVNDNDPKFLRTLYNATVLENSEPGVYITTVTATDIDTPFVQQPITYTLAQETAGQFVIDKNTGVIKTEKESFDREEKSVYKFLVFASDGIRTGSSHVRVQISDKNDERPIFNDGPYIRYVEENKEPLHPVGYVVAKDRDEGSNAMITYTLKSGTDQFLIEPNDGLIRTKVKLDRESDEKEFKVIVVGTDQGENPEKGEVEVTIKVTDANDQEPYFEQPVFSAQIEECGAIGDSITQVRAKDDDLNENAKLLFSIANGNTPRRFRIDPKTGIITIAHHLDYETKNNYKLSISVRDRGSPQKVGKNAEVDIGVIDCNDNSPRFTESIYKVTVREDTPIGTEIIRVTASDVDIGINGDFDFLISDPDENYQFTISKSPDNENEGIIWLHWMLDRETLKEHVINIGAKDRGSPSFIGFAQLTVEVEDVNDNAPVFIPNNICGFVEEEVTAVQTVATVQINDPDAIQHQCPCTYELIDPYDKFDIEYNAIESTKAIIKTKPGIKFDREAKGFQLYTLRVQATDRGMPKLTSETIVYVEVGDKDDNHPTSGGKMKIMVNSYQGHLKNNPIGRVLIIDRDRGINHTYSSNKMIPTSDVLNIDPHGMISVGNKNIPKGTYEFTVVSEKDKRLKVESTVDIIVREISDEMVRKSIPIRMTGLRKPLTCNEIKYIDFEPLLAEALEVDVSQVTVFSVMDVRSVPGAVDVWFSVLKRKGASGYGEDYMATMDMLVKLNDKILMIEQKTGGKMLSVGIDACARETCNKGFCYNEIQGSSKYTLVTDENGIVPPQLSGRTFVSLNVQVIPRCKSGPVLTDSCKELAKNPCRNGGICTSLEPSGYNCKCLPGFDGPQCQLTSRYVKDNGYFWLHPISYFYEGFISFEFSTTQPDGLILYHGPISKLSSEDVLDFLAVDLVDGKLRISASQGERKMFQRVLETDKILTDGAFHHVRIEKRGKSIEAILDHCNDAEVIESWTEPSIQNRQKCQLNGIIPGRWKFINGIYPLQIGGLRHFDLDYPDKRDLNLKPFKGCIRNIVDNGVMYDLRFPLLSYNSGTGCPASNVYCLTCLYGDCDMTKWIPGMKHFACQCKHGWMGKLCDRRVDAMSYRSASYSKYKVIKNPITWYDRYVTHYMVQVRTRGDGVILHEEGTHGTWNGIEYSILEIKNKKLQYRFNVGDGKLILSLPENVNVTDGKWHNITVYRRGNHATLEIMSDGVLAGRVSDSKGSHHLLDSNGILYVGGNVDNVENKTVIFNNFEGCIADNRYHHYYLDEKVQGMDDTNNNYVEIYRTNVYKHCTCDTAGIANCLNGGVCVAGSPSYCLCYFGWTGSFCGSKTGSPLAGSPPSMGSNGMMVLVILVLLFLLVVVLVALFIGRFRKKNKAMSIYVDEGGRENIMPYNDEGAGEDDFQNFDFEKLLQHKGGKNLVYMDEFAGAGVANGAGAAGGGYAMACGFSGSREQSTSTVKTSLFSSNKSASNGETQPLIQEKGQFEEESVDTVNSKYRTETSFTTNFKDSVYAWKGSKADDIDIAAFIQANLAEADNDDAYLPRDTLLHYGYEGEMSDVDDLSELSEDDDEEDDFTFLRDFGPNFCDVNIIFNPEDEYDDEV